MPKFRVVAAAVALLLTGCMTGPIPIASNHGDDNSINPSGPSETRLPGAPAIRAEPP